jgi:hypothetical protein
MKLVISFLLAIVLLFTGAAHSPWIDAGDQIVAHAGNTRPWTFREAIESCIDDRIIASFASEPSAFHCRPAASSLIYRSIKRTNTIKADIKIYKLNAAFLI